MIGDFPVGWGLGQYSDDELSAALANVERHLAGVGLDNRERLQARRVAILAEQDERALIAACERPHP